MRVLVTGAVEGLGRALCDRLLEDGHFVLAIDHNIDGLQQLKQQWGEIVSIMQVDLSDRADVDVMLKDLNAIAPFDRAILNAGISATGKFEDIPTPAYQNLLRINTEAPMVMASFLARSGLVGNGGSIAFISSLSHMTGYPGASVYCASKDAIAIYAKSIRAAYAKKGINVLTVFPGPVRTGHAERHAPVGADATKRMAPGELAKRILAALDKRQAVLYPGATAVITRIAGSLLPGSMSRLMRRIIFEKLDHTTF